MTMVTEKPWGRETLIHQGHGYAVKIITLQKRMSTSLHYHEQKHETIVVFAGSLTVTLGTEVASLSQIHLETGDFLVVDPLVLHRMTANSKDCTYFEAQSDFLDDVVRILDEHCSSR